jgi:hypothetical protein
MPIDSISRVDNIIWRRIGDDIVVISDDGVATHVLNKTAAFIWELCDGKNGIDEIVASLLEKYEVSEEEVKADVREIIDKLVNLNILQLNGRLLEID